MPESVIKNENLRHDVTVIEEMPDLDQFGRAGIRLKLDMMLSAVHGVSVREWQRLSADEHDVLRLIAREEDPAWGVSHQVDAIGALAESGDEGALLQLSDLARNAQADMRIRIAATYALGEIGGPQVRPVLRELLQVQQPEVRAQAALGLGKAGDPSDLITLELLHDADETLVSGMAMRAIDALNVRFRPPGE